MAFITREGDLNPRSLLAGGDALAWTTVEFNRIRAQFFLDVGPTESSLAEAWITDSPDALVTAVGKLKAKTPTASIRVLLLSPRRLNQGRNWQLEPLAEIWQRYVPALLGHEYRFVLEDGRTYEDVYADLPSEERKQSGPWEKVSWLL